MLNKFNVGNRRMIMSAEILNVYQQDANKTSKGDERNEQNTEALYEHDDKFIYELGYN